MVRFARAKGSKASNERRFEEATSWSEMKQQMIDAQNKVFTNIEGNNCDSLNEETSPINTASWAEFDAPAVKRDNKSNKQFSTHLAENTKINNKKKKKLNSEPSEQPYSPQEENSEDIRLKKKKQKHNSKSSVQPPLAHEDFENISLKKKKTKQNLDSTEQSCSSYEDNSEICIHPRKKKPKRHSDLTEKPCLQQDDSKDESSKKKKQKDRSKQEVNNASRCSIPLTNEAIPETIDQETVSGKSKRLKKKEKKLHKPDDLEPSKVLELEATENNLKNERKFEKKLEMKQVLTKHQMRKTRLPIMRRKAISSPGVQTINIGGRVVEICMFDGFPVLKDDWERLVELKKKMKEQGIPGDEMRASLKLERRRAEKALARERKKVCFHCRQPGHFLSECPSLNEQNSFSKKKDIPDSVNSGICFKCGSTEHSYLECRVVKRDDFKYASCFVCGEQGHISRQCPDNPRGMYPKGGACNVCGDVTHLKKDCPKYQKEQQQWAVTLPTLKNHGALEALEIDSSKEVSLVPRKPKKKIIKF